MKVSNMVIIGTVLVIVIVAAVVMNSNSGNYDGFAQCLSEKGAVMYGAYWCGHCKNQKEMFGNSFQYINYTECWDNATNSQNDICNEAGIPGYPTWVFADGSRLSKEVPLNVLAEKTDCKID